MQDRATPGPSTDRERYAKGPTQWWRVKGHNGIAFRLSSSLERTYGPYSTEKGQYVPTGRTLEEALVKQGEWRKAKMRGERPLIDTKISFGVLAEEWWEVKEPRLRQRTRDQYRSALDLV